MTGPAETMQTTPLAGFPPPEKWDDWVEYDPVAWPRKVERHYSLVPTTCFNCEAACGLVAYVDQETNRITKLEGNPHHPGSRGRNCAKGPATINQVHDPDRILYPMKRVGARGSGKFERVSWDEVLDHFAGRIRKAIEEKRLTEVMYHVGRPGHDGYVERVLQSWGVDGHNSHTNVCSAAARLGYALWSGHDRPSPDYANAKFVLLISSHLETGHYFNPHAQRIVEGAMAGAKIAACDVRLSNTASRADYWLATRPGTEALMLLGFAHVILEERLYDREFLEHWVEWRGFLRARDIEPGFETFLLELEKEYAWATPEHVSEITGLDRETIVTVAREIGSAGSAFASHIWRNAASGNEGGWQVARCLQFVSALVGAVSSVGGTGLAGTHKFVPAPHSKPSPQQAWSELLYPKQWPLSHHELSFLLPHLLKDGAGRVDTYFTRVYNPVWTNPDGAMWIEVLQDESLVGSHAVLSPVWNETARWADYVLPMGVAPERHDLMSQETHAASWISFRQPVHRVLAQRRGENVEWTHEVNPGEVWEEDEFWIALSWRIDPDGSLGIRKHFESPYRAGERITIDEYYRWIFENSVPGLPEAAAAEGLSPMEYMRRHGCFQVQDRVYQTHETPLDDAGLERDEENAVVTGGGEVKGVLVGGQARVGFPTPSRRLELHSRTMVDWGWPEHSLPGYIESHVDDSRLDRGRNEFALVSTFRLPTLIHTRSANSKWLTELSNTNPVWIHPTDAARVQVDTGDLVRVSTRTGYYVNRAWVTEGVRPGVVVCSHHMGRWKVSGDGQGGNRWQLHDVELQVEDGRYLIRRRQGVRPFESNDPDSDKVWWSSGGVHQNMTFPVQPDPVSGMHCWHQKVTVTKAEPEDRYGDVFADTNKSMEVYREWLAKARPAPGPDGLRRPLHFKRVARPSEDTFRIGS